LEKPNGGRALPVPFFHFWAAMAGKWGLSASLSDRCDLASIVYNIDLLKLPDF
jgi:hypothetical protein